MSDVESDHDTTNDGLSAQSSVVLEPSEVTMPSKSKSKSTTKTKKKTSNSKRKAVSSAIVDNSDDEGDVPEGQSSKVSAKPSVPKSPPKRARKSGSKAKKSKSKKVEFAEPDAGEDSSEEIPVIVVHHTDAADEDETDYIPTNSTTGTKDKMSAAAIARELREAEKEDKSLRKTADAKIYSMMPKKGRPDPVHCLVTPPFKRISKYTPDEFHAYLKAQFERAADACEVGDPAVERHASTVRDVVHAMMQRPSKVQGSGMEMLTTVFGHMFGEDNDVNLGKLHTSQSKQAVKVNVRLMKRWTNHRNAPPPQEFRASNIEPIRESSLMEETAKGSKVNPYHAPMVTALEGLQFKKIGGLYPFCVYTGEGNVVVGMGTTRTSRTDNAKTQSVPSLTATVTLNYEEDISGHPEAIGESLTRCMVALVVATHNGYYTAAAIPKYLEAFQVMCGSQHTSLDILEMVTVTVPDIVATFTKTTANMFTYGTRTEPISFKTVNYGCLKDLGSNLATRFLQQARETAVLPSLSDIYTAILVGNYIMCAPTLGEKLASTPITFVIEALSTLCTEPTNTDKTRFQPSRKKVSPDVIIDDDDTIFLNDNDATSHSAATYMGVDSETMADKPDEDDGMDVDEIPVICTTLATKKQQQNALAQIPQALLANKTEIVKRAQDNVNNIKHGMSKAHTLSELIDPQISDIMTKNSQSLHNIMLYHEKIKLCKESQETLKEYQDLLDNYLETTEDEVGQADRYANKAYVNLTQNIRRLTNTIQTARKEIEYSMWADWFFNSLLFHLGGSPHILTQMTHDLTTDICYRTMLAYSQQRAQDAVQSILSEQLMALTDATTPDAPKLAITPKQTPQEMVQATRAYIEEFQKQKIDALKTAQDNLEDDDSEDKAEQMQALQARIEQLQLEKNQTEEKLEKALSAAPTSMDDGDNSTDTISMDQALSALSHTYKLNRSNINEIKVVKVRTNRLKKLKSSIETQIKSLQVSEDQMQEYFEEILYLIATDIENPEPQEQVSKSTRTSKRSAAATARKRITTA